MAAVGENFGGIRSMEWRALESSGLTRFRNGDTLFAKITPCPENGKIAFVNHLPKEYVLGSTEFIVLSPKDECNPRFLYHLPVSWEIVPVESVAIRFEYGLSVPMQLEGTMPILRMGNIQQGEIILEDLKYVTLPLETIEPYIAHRGDVLFNRTNSQEHVGKVGIYRSDLPSVFASYLIRVVPNPELVDSYFLGQLLNSYDCQCRIKRYATPGVQQVNINATNLGKVLIPLPVGASGLDEQRGIAAILEKADECIRIRKPFLESLLVLKRSLMHDLLSGKVRVGTVKQLNLFGEETRK